MSRDPVEAPACRLVTIEIPSIFVGTMGDWLYIDGVKQKRFDVILLLLL